PQRTETATPRNWSAAPILLQSEISERLTLQSRRLYSPHIFGLPRGGSMKRAARGAIGGVLAILLSSAMLSAQAGSTAQISGLVRDTSAGVLPGGDVTAKQTATGLKRSTVTQANGSYTLPNLPIGPYRLDVNLPGFKSYVRTGLVLQVNDAPVINVELSIGAVEETVQVQAASPLVETRSTGL